MVLTDQQLHSALRDLAELGFVLFDDREDAMQFMDAVHEDLPQPPPLSLRAGVTGGWFVEALEDRHGH